MILCTHSVLFFCTVQPQCSEYRRQAEQYRQGCAVAGPTWHCIAGPPQSIIPDTKGLGQLFDPLFSPNPISSGLTQGSGV